MKRNMLKKIVAVVCCFGFVLSTTRPVMAAQYEVKMEPCPRCGQWNSSYAYESDSVCSTISLNSGHYCDGCHTTIPTGDYHMYLYTSDKYFFMCKSSKCARFSVPDRVYTVFYDNPAYEHHTNGQLDYSHYPRS